MLSCCFIHPFIFSKTYLLSIYFIRCLIRDTLSVPKNWCFWTMVLEKTLDLTSRRSNQSVLKEISPEYSLERLMLKLKPQYFGHQMWRDDSLEKTLMLGKTEDRGRRGQWRTRWLDGITDSMDMDLRWWRTGKPGVLQSFGSQRVRQDWVIEQELSAGYTEWSIWGDPILAS